MEFRKMSTLKVDEKSALFSVSLRKNSRNVTPIQTSNQAQNFSQVV